MVLGCVPAVLGRVGDMPPSDVTLCLCCKHPHPPPPQETLLTGGRTRTSLAGTPALPPTVILGQVTEML